MQNVIVICKEKTPKYSIKQIDMWNIKIEIYLVDYNALVCLFSVLRSIR